MDPLRAALAKYVCVYKMIFFLHTYYNEYTLFCYHFHHHPPSPQKCSELLAYIFSCSHLNWYLACHSPKCSSKNITLNKSATNFTREINNRLQVDNFFFMLWLFNIVSTLSTTVYASYITVKICWAQNVTYCRKTHTSVLLWICIKRKTILVGCFTVDNIMANRTAI